MIDTVKSAWAAFVERVRGWRTYAFGVLLALLSAYDMAVAAGLDLAPIVPEQYRPQFQFGIALAVMGLRYITTSVPRDAEA